MANKSNENNGLPARNHRQKEIVNDINKLNEKVNAQIKELNEFIENQKQAFSEKHGIPLKMSPIETFGMVPSLELQVIDTKTGEVKEHRLIDQSGEHYIKKPKEG